MKQHFFPLPVMLLIFLLPINLKKHTKTSATTQPSQLELVDVVLDYIGVSESTRNKIDNNDCKRVFGYIYTELWKLDASNKKVSRIAAYDNQIEYLFLEKNFRNPNTSAYSYYQESLPSNNSNSNIITYNIPKNLLDNKKVMLVVKSYLGTRHKDNDFASYDALKMDYMDQSSFLLDAGKSRQVTISCITGRISKGMGFSDVDIPAKVFFGTDDTHKLWVGITIKKK